jgi:osmoprotectant transport system permease protein
MKVGPALLIRLILAALLLALVLWPEGFASLLRTVNRPEAPPLYPHDSLLSLSLSHLWLVFVATAAGAVTAVAAALYVTRSSGAEFLPLSRAIANIGQTFPPVAVLALAVPAVGFGVAPTLIALFLYGLLPIFENSVAGLKQVPATVLEAADGMGMTPLQRLLKVELPLALPLMLEGVKIATVINIGTATIGSTVAAKGLGEVIIAGLLSDNTAFILHGGVIVGLMAVLLYDLMGLAERAIRARFGLPVTALE